MSIEEIRQKAWENFQEVFQKACTESDKKVEDLFTEESIQKSIERLQAFAMKDRVIVERKCAALKNEKYLQSRIDEWENLQGKSADELRQMVLAEREESRKRIVGAKELQVIFVKKVLDCLSYDPMTPNLIVDRAELPTSTVGIGTEIERIMNAFGNTIQRVDVCYINIDDTAKAKGLPPELVLHPVRNNSLNLWKSLLYSIKNGTGGCKYATLYCHSNGC